MTQNIFNEHEVLHELKHYLPSQTPLKDFIHHNSLHAFQEMKFYDAIFKASKIFGFQATLPLGDFRKLYQIGRINDEILVRIIAEKKGSEHIRFWKENVLDKNYDEHNEQRIGKLRVNWKNKYQLDLDNLVQPLLFRILSSYLDQGIAMWDFPNHEDGFLASLISLEKNSFVSFFKTTRAKKLLFQENISIHELLKVVVGEEQFFAQYLFDQQFSHRGWSGMVATLEEKPESLLCRKKISLKDLIIFELLLEIDHLESELGKNFPALSTVINQEPVELFADIENTELQEVLKIWQDAFEWSYYDEILAGIQENISLRTDDPAPDAAKTFQSLFCIDERECSLRMHLESLDETAETFGCPGFFGVEFYFQAEHAKFYDKLCPAPVTPQYLIKEYDVSEKRKHDLFYTDKTHQIASGFLSALTFGFWAGYRLIKNLFRPEMSPAISNAFAHMNEQGKLTIENKHPDDRENGLQIGFTIEEMCNRVEALLRGIGLLDHFAPLIYVVAHGSSSANNPHHGAHDCGACSGRPGSVNSRVFAALANHTGVRKLLQQRGINIPTQTQFVGALHDTAADEIEYYDLSILNEQNKKAHEKISMTFESALDINAKERSRRFASINTKADLKQIRRAVKSRSVSLFEPRPELGHGTNTLCIVGNREMTKGVFLDRRSFLNSYNYKTDPGGKFLTGVMAPLGPVCGGINLEYYFSRVDNYKLGAGTKLPHNVVGLFGVANSSDGDLRPGLPWQMIEVHDPLRLLIIVEHYPEVILKSIQSSPAMYEWYINEWVHLVSIHPETRVLTYFKNGQFVPYQTLAKEIHFYKDVHALLEEAKEMKTNHIVHATQENLPVYLHN
ncbi:MAG: YbcC family protein [Saprospiraceae bacterium]